MEQLLIKQVEPQFQKRRQQRTDIFQTPCQSSEDAHTILHDIEFTPGKLRPKKRKEAWQQTRQCLHRWVHITSIGYGLLQLLSCIDNKNVAALCTHSPWRPTCPKTPGQIRKGLLRILMHVDIRSWWDATCEKFQPPNGAKNANTS